ncbi:hypothetical protein CJP74_03135 [Psittacicella melopsittaci]|uniref:Cell division protein FtsZ n=1 Tax=Psittacicella melopsittaci TaxID=2028576 RepID=A0A3A1Y6T5_9GAMM|nr:hypothetical protein [Psittacicella melopsittaci]RIY32989.1 hypothetical protein CJP74_03135 [Psittacicella melopsittaci]
MTIQTTMENEIVLPVLNSNGGKTEMKERDQLEKIIVIGVGGAGNNAVDYLYKQPGYMDNVGKSVIHYIFNTDENCLNNLQCENKLVLGKNTLKGKGAGANINVGRNATVESIKEITEIVTGADLVFITAGMGGGTGTLGSSIVAEAAKSVGAIVVSLVTLPFRYENRKRNAFYGIKNLYKYSDSLIMIDNQKIVDFYPDYEFTQGLDEANKILSNAISGVIKIIRNPTTINTDFEDLKTILNNGGKSQILYRSLAGQELEKINEDPDATIDYIYNEVTTSPLITRSNIEQATAFLILLECSSHFTQRIMNQFVSKFSRVNQNDDDDILDELLDDLDNLDEEKIESIKNNGPQVIFAYDKLPDTEDNAPRLNITIVATGMGTHDSNRENEQTIVPIQESISHTLPTHKVTPTPTVNNKVADNLSIQPDRSAKILDNRAAQAPAPKATPAPAAPAAAVATAATATAAVNQGDLFAQLSNLDDAIKQQILEALQAAGQGQASTADNAAEYRSPVLPEANNPFVNPKAEEKEAPKEKELSFLADDLAIDE